METERTSVFRVPAGQYASAEARIRLRKTGWIPALCVVSALVAAVFDTRFLYVALMLVFIVFPMALTMGWLSIVSKPVYIKRQRSQSWNIGDKGILRICYYEGETPVDSEEIPLESISDIETGKHYTTLRLDHKECDGILIVPTDKAPQWPSGILNNNIE